MFTVHFLCQGAWGRRDAGEWKQEGPLKLHQEPILKKKEKNNDLKFVPRCRKQGGMLGNDGRMEGLN